MTRFASKQIVGTGVRLILITTVITVTVIVIHMRHRYLVASGSTGEILTTDSCYVRSPDRMTFGLMLVYLRPSSRHVLVQLHDRIQLMHRKEYTDDEDGDENSFRRDATHVPTVQHEHHH